MKRTYAIIERTKSNREIAEQFNKLAILSAGALQHIHYFLPRQGLQKHSNAPCSGTEIEIFGEAISTHKKGMEKQYYEQ